MGGYFKTLDIPRLAGRDFNSMDRTGSALVAIVNDTLAERLWPNQNPINLKFDRPDGSAVEVVGLVHDGNGDSRGSALPFVYFPLLQNPNPMRVHASVVVVRSAGFDATSITGLVQRTAFDLDDQTAAFNVHTLQNEFDAAFLPNRIAMYVAGAPGILAFLLSVIGAYGTMALLTAQRRREIGIRIALGAHPSNAVAMMMKEAMKWTAAGISLGVLGALGLLWALNREFAGNSHILRFDSSAFAFGIIVLAVTAATACYIPVKRASRLNPIEVLRNE
jgi:putative ABC transport system permease protein